MGDLSQDSGILLRGRKHGGGWGGVGQPIFFAFPFQYNIINVSGLGTG